MLWVGGRQNHTPYSGLAGPLLPSVAMKIKQNVNVKSPVRVKLHPNLILLTL